MQNDVYQLFISKKKDWKVWGVLCNAPKKHKNRFSVALTERRFFL